MQSSNGWIRETSRRMTLTTCSGLPDRKRSTCAPASREPPAPVFLKRSIGSLTTSKRLKNFCISRRRCSAARSPPNPVVEAREEVILILNLLEPSLIDLLAPDLVIQSRKTQHVVVGPFRGVGYGGSCLHDKGPIGRLGEEKFSPRLV